VSQNKDVIAQAVYLAQLQAAKGSCKCKCCELLRKATDAMTEQMLNPQPESSVMTNQGRELINKAMKATEGLENVEV
jgi:hypothetical protein